MKTTQQIVDRIKMLDSDRHLNEDFFGFIRSDLIEALPFADAKPFLKSTATDDAWPTDKLLTTDEKVIARLTEYMTFAWEKANNCRGLSAARTLDHMRAWLWLLGEDKASDGIAEYDLYGKPQLRAICEHFKIDWRALDDGHWRSSEREDGKPADAVSELVLEWQG